MMMLPQSGLMHTALGLASLLFTYLSIRPLMPLMRRYALARPNARSSHKVPTPQGGGIPIVLAIAFGLFVALGLGLVPDADKPVAWVLAFSVLALAVLGLFDDIKPLPVLPRLGVQFGVSIALMIATPSDILLFHGVVPLIIERALVVIALVWMINLTNFMDGIDWITVAEFVPLSGALVVAALIGIASPIIGIVAVLLLGGLLGFAPYNKPVAKLFLGDVGSLPIGLVAGYALYRYGASTHIVSALILALYPLTDATLTLVRRVLRGEKIFEAHRSHFYQQATNNGYRVIEVVTHVAFAGAIFAALSLTIATTTSALLIGVMAVLALIGVTGLLRRFVTKI